jgi:hypothetical protein
MDAAGDLCEGPAETIDSSSYCLCLGFLLRVTMLMYDELELTESCHSEGWSFFCDDDDSDHSWGGRLLLFMVGV